MITAKGADTRNSVLERAVALASKVGLGGLTIGTLAEDLKLSKSGLFGHFRSKEAALGERSEEHTSELQSLRHLVCRLLLEKKKTENERALQIRHRRTLNDAA